MRCRTLSSVKSQQSDQVWGDSKSVRLVATTMKRKVFCFGLILSTALAGAQSFNIEFDGSVPSVPPSSYGAAGLAGVWNTPPGLFGAPSTLDLVDLTGASTTATFSWLLDSRFNFGLSFTGSDALLMNDTWGGGPITLSGLLPGSYEVILYTPFVNTFIIGQETLNTTGRTFGPLEEGINFVRFASVDASNSEMSISALGSVAGMQVRFLGSEPVPEPFTMALLGAGALVGYRRMRKRA